MTADSRHVDLRDNPTAHADGATWANGAGRRPEQRRRWRRIGLVLIVAVVAAAYFAPFVMARYLETNGWTLTDEDGTRFHIDVGKASLSWFSPVRLANVQIDDADGQTLLVATHVVSERSLSLLVADHRRPGRFFIDQPTVTVIVRPDGSNLEDLFRVLKRDKGSSGVMNVGGTITQGMLTFADAAGRSVARLEDINSSAQAQRDADRKITLEWNSVVVTEDARQPVVAAVDWQGPKLGLPFLSGAGTFALKLSPLPIAPLEPQLARLFPDLSIQSGTIAVDVLVESDFRDAQAIKATGEIVCRQVRGAIHSTAGPPTEFLWPEERASFHVDGLFDSTEDVIRVKELRVESTPLDVDATGTVSDLDGECVADVSGELRCDVDHLIQSLAAELRSEVQVEGLRTRRFEIHGPLAAIASSAEPVSEGGDLARHWDVSRLNVEADVHWDRANAFGVQSQQATIVGQFRDGMLRLDPRDVPVSGGRLLAAAQITLLNAEPTLTIGQGPALDNVQFSEEMCRQWLKYLSPPLANATRVSGRFSIDLNEGRFLLKDLETGRVSGVLHVHEAQARPGPFADRLFGLIETIRNLIERKPGRRIDERVIMTLGDQQVPFSMADGRVRHERLQLNVAGTIVYSSGSVGLDESLDLIIDVPLPASWLRHDALVAAVGGEVLRIPVRGSLDRPQFDQTFLRDLTRKLAVEATGGLLQKLFD